MRTGVVLERERMMDVEPQAPSTVSRV
jgi:hypothetical protein